MEVHKMAYQILHRTFSLNLGRLTAIHTRFQYHQLSTSRRMRKINSSFIQSPSKIHTADTKEALI
jgi:hypothetical protein